MTARSSFARIGIIGAGVGSLGTGMALQRTYGRPAQLRLSFSEAL